MRGKRHPRLAALVKLPVAVVAAGVLGAGLLLPWVAGAGVLARDLGTPADDGLRLEDVELLPNTRVLAADGSLVTEFFRYDREPVAGEQIAEVLKRALVDIEDARFYDHHGLDVEGTARALVRNVSAGAVEQGGSTLTQQLVKQTLLQTARTERERAVATETSVQRKLREARLALAVEERYSKDEILTRYLNLAYFGQGAYGVQAAAQRYFGVGAGDVTVPQAAVLAGLVQSPVNDDPIAHPGAARVRRDAVLTRMHQLGHLTDEELSAATATPVDTSGGRPPPRGCVDATTGGYFCAYLLDHLIRALGLTRTEIEEGGLTIRTTLRPDVQAAGDRAVLAALPMGHPLAATFTAVEAGTGHVLAMSTNRRYGCAGPECESVVLNTAHGQGAGSTYKVFTAAAALERGVPADHAITTANPYVSRVFLDEGRPYEVRAFAAADRPTLTMEEALFLSSNTYFVALQDELGSVEGPVRVAERMGMHFTASSAEEIIAGNRGSFTLGAEATSPLDLANAFATLAAAGTRCDPTPVVEVLDASGRPLTRAGGGLLVPGATCHPDAVPRAVATTLAQLMRKDVEPGVPGQTGAAAYVPGHQIAGKTGTAQDAFSIAFAGFTPQYSASVMVSNPKQNQDVGMSSGAAARIWHDAWAPVLAGQPAVPFPPADPVLAGSTVPLGPPPGPR